MGTHVGFAFVKMKKQDKDLFCYGAVLKRYLSF